MRTWDAVWEEMLAVVADARAAAAVNDEVSVDLDHERLNELITEIKQIPIQHRHA